MKHRSGSEFRRDPKRLLNQGEILEGGCWLVHLQHDWEAEHAERGNLEGGLATELAERITRGKAQRGASRRGTYKLAFHEPRPKKSRRTQRPQERYESGGQFRIDLPLCEHEFGRTELRKLRPVGAFRGGLGHESQSLRNRPMRQASDSVKQRHRSGLLRDHLHRNRLGAADVHVALRVRNFDVVFL